MRRRLALLRLVLDHPLNRSNRPLAATRWAGWQAWKTIVKRPLTTKIWKELRVRVYPDWPYSWTAIYMRLAEYDDMMFTLRCLKPGDAVVDVGANIGYYTLLAASVNGGAPVLSFEPHPIAATRLRENVRLNRLDNVFVIEAALGDIAGLGRLTTSLYDENRITLEETLDSATVRLVTLDGELKREGVPPSSVALVKIDTEGFEAHVLRGASDLVQSLPGPAWIVEMTGLGRRYGSDDEDVLSLFKQNGYAACSYSAQKNALVPLDLQSRVGGNVIFARDIDALNAKLGVQPTSRPRLEADAERSR